MHLNHLSLDLSEKKHFKQKLQREMNHTLQAECLLLVFSQLTMQQTDRQTELLPSEHHTSMTTPYPPKKK
jgi:hypothetical protein